MVKFNRVEVIATLVKISLLMAQLVYTVCHKREQSGSFAITTQIIVSLW